MLASLYGSTILYGIGNDLDVMMTEQKDGKPNIEDFLREFGGKEMHRTVEPRRFSVKVEKRGRYYDFCFENIGKRIGGSNE
jgi:hypothetical protein